MKRLTFLILTVCALCAAARDREVRLRIIETSDIHGNYFPYIAIAQRERLS